jgi:hypothetical protein
MKRGEIQRTEFVRAPSKEPKPGKGPRKRLCAVCRESFPKQRMGQQVCGPLCARKFAEAIAAKQERKADKQRKKESLTLAQRAEPVRKLAQRYAVLRDHAYGCISCDKGPHWTGGKWHGSHFKSVGSNSALQFNLWNIQKACEQCNYFMAGNIGPYETRLRQKYGDERVDWLKCHPREREYPQDYLDRLAAILRKKIRRAEKRLGIRR